jgi:hypothetical protein
MPMFATNSVPIYGVVGFARLVVTAGNENYDEYLLGYGRETHQQLELEIANLVRQTLGPEFEVYNVRIEKGSITVWVVLSVLGTLFMGVSRYESFIKSVNLLMSQLKGLLGRFFGQAPGNERRPPVTVTGSWEPSEVVTTAHQALSHSKGIDSSQVVLAYLLLSHAALLGVLVWLVIRHLK